MMDMARIKQLGKAKQNIRMTIAALQSEPPSDENNVAIDALEEAVAVLHELSRAEISASDIQES
jgi:hypothetical protein